MKLPKKIKLDKHLLREEFKYELLDGVCEGDAAWEELVCDYLTEKVGFCIKSWCYKITKNSVICYDIEWDISD